MTWPIDIVAATNESTVVAEHEPTPPRSGAYQSEAEMERELIRMLVSQGYEHLSVHDEAGLVANLRRQLEILNDMTFTDGEWDRFFKTAIVSSDAEDGILEKARKIQEDHVQLLRRDDGTTKNVMLLDKKDVHRNRLQVISQYEEPGGTYAARYDVTILVDGLPLVHVELKRRGVALREAFAQIDRYQRTSFWASSGLFGYVQVFVISNGTHTKYYSNTTRDRHVKKAGAGARRRCGTDSFESTSFWADANNRPIMDIEGFTKTFFARHVLLQILTRWCVLTEDGKLLVMRPYQIAATERILSRIATRGHYKKTGTLDAGGWVWHTTGSGKTLTSFKAAQLASRMEGVDKVLFVVDRKDLDYQTMREYDRFEKGAVNSNTSTKVLQRQLEDRSARIIITTIQKLDRFIRRNEGHEVFKKRCVIIFDECHRSQFGDMHTAIVKSFKDYHLFGFTGTPIFVENAVGSGALRTTQQAFGDRLHTYTIVDAIRDGNVLPFRVDYVDTFRQREGGRDMQVHAIDTERALAAPERIRNIVGYVLDHFDQKTMRSSSYELEGKRRFGFNSIFATSSIPMARQCYAEFRRQLEERGKRLTVALIYSYGANEELPGDVLPDEAFETEALDQSSRDFLEAAIRDYNETFHTSFDTSSEKFQSYYKDLSQRVKAREVDLLIVVNMFLTGFDAPTLNTLWVDKDLRHHGLLQAFSRTNRILSSVKAYGNIVCFRDLQKATEEAIALFGDKDASSMVLLKDFSSYYEGWDEDGRHHPGWTELVRELEEKSSSSFPIESEAAEREFISLFGAILRARNILSAFDEFAGKEILTEREMQDYQSLYIDLWQKRRKKVELEPIDQDLVFEMELVRQIEIDIDYILLLVEKYRASHCKDEEILTDIRRAVDSTLQLRSKKELILSFVQSVNASTKVRDEWRAFVARERERELDAVIAEEGLMPDETRRFIEDAFKDGELRTTGTALDPVMPPMSLFKGKRVEKKQSVIERLKAFFEKFFGIA